MMKESNHKERQLSIIGDEFDSLIKRIIECWAGCFWEDEAFT